MAQWLRTALLRSSLDSATLHQWRAWRFRCSTLVGVKSLKRYVSLKNKRKKQSSTTTTHATWQPVAWLCSIQCMHCSFAPHSYHTEFSPTICLDSPWFPGYGASLTKSSLVIRLWNIFMPRIGRVAVLQPKCWAEFMWHKNRIEYVCWVLTSI